MSRSSLAVLDSGSLATVATVPAGSNPLGVAVVGSDHHVYVTDNIPQGTTTKIDGATNSVLATIPVGAYPSGVTVDPATGRVYVADYYSNSVTVLQD